MPHITTVLNGSASLIPAFIHVDKNFLFDGGFGIDTDDGSQRLNVTNNVVLTGLWKDGIANSHKSYSGNVELFGGVSSGTCMYLLARVHCTFVYLLYPCPLVK